MTVMTTDARRPRRWDAVVRITHWSIVAAVLVNAVFAEEGSSTHVWVGYALAAILAARLIWGVIGPAEARFSAFPPSPRAAIAHIREIVAGEKRLHASHNPLGALMVYAIWACLLVIIGTGIAMAGLPGASRETRSTSAPVAAAAGPQVEARETEEREEGEGEEGEEGPLGEIHELAANLLYVLIALHLAGVVFETRRSGRQVVTAMLPGRR